MAVGAAAVTALLVGVLLKTPERVLGSNSITVAGLLGSAPSGTRICQTGERLPASTESLRISIAAYLGPGVSVAVLHDGRLLSRGERGAEWVSGSLTFRLHPALDSPVAATICLTRDGRNLALGLLGGATAPGVAATANGTALPGRMRVEYLARGHRSWLSLASTVARRMGLGHWPSGTWIVFLLLALMASACALGAKLVIGGGRYE
jgi:hypothetical protein